MKIINCLTIYFKSILKMTKYHTFLILVSLLLLANYVESLTIHSKETHSAAITHASDCLLSHLSKSYHLSQEEPPAAFLKAFGDLAK